MMMFFRAANVTETLNTSPVIYLSHFTLILMAVS